MYHIQELQRAEVRTFDNVLNLGKPFVHLAVVLGDVSILLVCPVGGDSLFGNVVHTLGADLDLHPIASFAHQRAVQRFVAVALRRLDPVAEAIRLETVNACDGGIYVIAHLPFLDRIVSLRLEDDAHRIQVENLVEGDVLGLHLVPDGVRSLHPLLYFIFVAVGFEGLVDRGYEIVYQGAGGCYVLFSE